VNWVVVVCPHCGELPDRQRWYADEVEFTKGIHRMRQEQRRYQFAGFCILFFIAAQTFQDLATRFWIPAAHGPEQELLIYLLRMDRARALLILSSILLLVIPYITITMRYWLATPIAAVSGLIAGISLLGLNSRLVASPGSWYRKQTCLEERA
jgi:hypothetical protein